MKRTTDRLTCMRSPSTAAADYRVIRKVTLVGGLVDVILAVGKLVGGFASQSQALIADGIHSISDLVTDLLVIVAARHASHEADSEHPYGHGRIQAIATAILAFSLAVVALGIAWDAVTRLKGDADLLSPGWIAVLIATVSVIAKEAVYQYTNKTAKALNSSLLRANAWHSRTDALSSIIVIVGVVGVMVGFPWADAVGAVGVGLIILYAAFKIGREAVDELIDTGLDQSTLALMHQTILEVPGVIGVHELRTRRMGSQLLADMHIHVDPLISVSEGHSIGDRVMGLLGHKFKRLTDVVVHIDPEDDLMIPNSEDLPLRPEIERAVRECLIKAKKSEVQTGIEDFDLVLHYIGGSITAELTFPLPASELRGVLEEESQALSEQLITETPLSAVRIFYRA